jgi:hypothetical protein
MEVLLNIETLAYGAQSCTQGTRTEYIRYDNLIEERILSGAYMRTCGAAPRFDARRPTGCSLASYELCHMRTAIVIVHIAATYSA